MKKTFKLKAVLRIAGITAIAAVIVFTAAACSGSGGLSGTYKFDGMDVSYTFSGNKVTYKVSDSYTAEGTYKTSGGEITFTMDGFEESQVFKYTKQGNKIILSLDGVESTLTKQ